MTHTTCWKRDQWKLVGENLVLYSAIFLENVFHCHSPYVEEVENYVSRVYVEYI